MSRRLSAEAIASRRRAARASARARRQIARESIVVAIKIVPAHELSPEQLAVWRSFWRAVLAAEPDLPGDDEAEGGEQ